MNNLAKRFPNIVKESDVDSLVEEFQDFQLASKDELPCLDLNVEIFWSKMSDLKLAFGSSKRFPNLCNLAKACLVLPVSNAEVERVFSLLKKFKLSSGVI